MRQVREQADNQRQNSPWRALRVRVETPKREDLGFLQSSQDLADVRFSSHRKVVGEAITYAKKRASTPDPVLERQSAYNAVNTRLMSYLCDRIERMEGKWRRRWMLFARKRQASWTPCGRRSSGSWKRSSSTRRRRSRVCKWKWRLRVENVAPRGDI
jgi:hypothetical protein